MNPDAAEEALCIRRAAAGDRAAFARLVQAHQGYLRKLLTRLCQGDAARADDLAQEVFLIAYAKIGSSDRATFVAWLLGIARNQLRNHWRSRARRSSSTVHTTQLPATPTS